jgi:phosphoserine phosphatase SerB
VILSLVGDSPELIRSWAETWIQSLMGPPSAVHAHSFHAPAPCVRIQYHFDSTEIKSHTILDQVKTCPFPLLAAAWLPAGLPTPKLVAFDMDSTLIQQEVIDEIGRELNQYERFAEITENAMQGRIDFVQAFHERIGLLKGLTLSRAESIIPRLSLNPGADDFVQWLKEQRAHTMIVSGGFDFVLKHFQQTLGIDEIHAHHLIQDSQACLTGEVRLPMIDSHQKQRLVHERQQALKLSPASTITIGDGANDIAMMNEASIKVSFCGKPKLEAAANTWVLDRNYAWLQVILTSR